TRSPGTRAPRGCGSSLGPPRRWHRRPRPSRLRAPCVDVDLEGEPLVNGMDGALRIGGPDHARYADRGGRDHLDVDAFGREHLEHVRRYTRVRLHARADERDLRDAVVDGEPLRADLLDDTVHRALQPWHVDE